MSRVGLFVSVLLLTVSAWGESASERYQSINCLPESIDLEKSIEATLQAEKAAVDRRMAMQGFKGESLSKMRDVSVECNDISKTYFSRNNRVVVSAFYQIRTNLCRFQFSVKSSESEVAPLNFEYIHCVHNQ